MLQGHLLLLVCFVTQHCGFLSSCVPLPSRNPVLHVSGSSFKAVSPKLSERRGVFTCFILNNHYSCGACETVSPPARLFAGRQFSFASPLTFGAQCVAPKQDSMVLGVSFERGSAARGFRACKNVACSSSSSLRFGSHQVADRMPRKLDADLQALNKRSLLPPKQGCAPSVPLCDGFPFLPCCR